VVRFISSVVEVPVNRVVALASNFFSDDRCHFPGEPHKAKFRHSTSTIPEISGVKRINSAVCLDFMASKSATCNKDDHPLILASKDVHQTTREIYPQIRPRQRPWTFIEYTDLEIDSFPLFSDLPIINGLHQLDFRHQEHCASPP
jgi:hypothetical protein